VVIVLRTLSCTDVIYDMIFLSLSLRREGRLLELLQPCHVENLEITPFGRLIDVKKNVL